MEYSPAIPGICVRDGGRHGSRPSRRSPALLDKALRVQPPRHTISERLKAAGLEPTDDACNMLWLDDALGALINKLEELNELDNTVIFFFNDQWMEAKGTVYEGGAHTPSIVNRKGGFPVGPTCDALVSSVDFAPTILDFAQIPYSKNAFDGESFLPYLMGKKQRPDRTIYLELGYARAIIKGNWKYMALRYPPSVANMSLEERKKLLDDWNAKRIHQHLNIVTTDPKAGFSHLTAIPGGSDAESKSTGTEHYPGYYDPDQLYDLSRDPREQKNLARDPEYHQKLLQMKKELKKLVSNIPATLRYNTKLDIQNNPVRISHTEAQRHASLTSRLASWRGISPAFTLCVSVSCATAGRSGAIHQGGFFQFQPGNLRKEDAAFGRTPKDVQINIVPFAGCRPP